MWRSRARENGVVLVTSISGSSGTCPSRILTADGEVQSETYIGQTYAAATVDLSDAGAVSDAAFSGTGTVLGGTFAGKTRIVLSDAADDWSGASVPTFDSCSFGGRVVVDFGRTSEDPLDDPGMSSESIVVAKFRNGTPDVSGWRLKSSSTGLRAVGGTFSVDVERGEVRMVPGHVGAILIVQ